jgi:hypothetical protein
MFVGGQSSAEGARFDLRSGVTGVCWFTVQFGGRGPLGSFPGYAYVQDLINVLGL